MYIHWDILSIHPKQMIWLLYKAVDVKLLINENEFKPNYSEQLACKWYSN